MLLVTVQQAYYTLYWGVASASLQRVQDAANYLTRVLFKGVVHRKESFFMTQNNLNAVLIHKHIYLCSKNDDKA